jgi:hypothetical protein
MLFPEGWPARGTERKGGDQSSRQGSEKVRHGVLPLKKREGRPVPGFPSRPISPVKQTTGPPEKKERAADPIVTTAPVASEFQPEGAAFVPSGRTPLVKRPCE